MNLAMCISYLPEFACNLIFWCRITTFHAHRTSRSPRHLVNQSKFRRGTSLVYHETASQWITVSLLQILGDGMQQDNCTVGNSLVFY